MTKERAMELISESLESLNDGDMLDADMTINSDTILLGNESPLDSIGFVTFVTELEEKISDDTQKDLYLVLDEINEFNINNPQLSADSLAKYIVKLSG